MDTGPVVWPLLQPLAPTELAQRFAAEWESWYGPGLAPHARLIGELLQADAAASAALRRPRGVDAAARPWPAGWVLPVVRRRGRLLRLRLPAGAPADWWPAGAARTTAWLGFEWRGYWGAHCDPASRSAERARWLGGPGRSRAWLGPLAFATPAPACLERRLRDGVGLVVVQPWLGRAGSDGGGPDPRPDQLSRRSRLRLA